MPFDTGVKFTADVDTGIHICTRIYIDHSKSVPWQLRQQFSHLPKVLLAPVVHVDLRISSRIFLKNQNFPKRRPGKMMHEKDLK